MGWTECVLVAGTIFRLAFWTTMMEYIIAFHPLDLIHADPLLKDKYWTVTQCSSCPAHALEL